MLVTPFRSKVYTGNFRRRKPHGLRFRLVFRNPLVSAFDLTTKILILEVVAGLGMSDDSRVSDQPESLSDVELIRRDFRRALESGEIDIHGSNTFNFDDWLNRVDPEHRPRLAHYLTNLQQRHSAATVETIDMLSTNLEFSSNGDFEGSSAEVSLVPPSVHDAAHNAVFNCSTLSRLPENAKVALASRIERRQFAPGDRLICQGEPATGLHLLVSGRVEVVDNHRETSRRIDYDGPGSVVGEMSLLTGQDCSADVIAITNVVTLVLSVESFAILRDEYPELEVALSQLVSDRLGQRSHDALCGKTLGGFTLNRCISRGAMGVVYEARCEEDGTPRALKMLRHRFISDTRAQSRFDFEVDLLRNLRHDNIVRMHGSFVAYRTRFLTLDLCDGADLKRTLIEHGPMSESIVRGVLGQIAAGLMYAHAEGALHLDLKPANVLVDRSGKVSITDFGLGRLVKSDGCDESIAGTPSYMSPEQFKGIDVGPACDWYSLGCLGFELLTGRLLFPEKDLASMFNRKHLVAEQLWPDIDVSEDLKVALYSALEPMVEYRDLDLEQVASWARPVPELFLS